MRRLACHVHLLDEQGDSHVFTPDGRLPGWARKAITNPAAWSADEDDEAAGPPPKHGPGSGKEPWAEYAAAQSVEVADGASREDIVAALEAAGVPTE